MANSSTGKWVSRVGASGGSKAYKKARPSNYYGILGLIVVLGLLSTVLARYDYQHPAAAVTGTPPTVGTTWFAALSVQACGEDLGYLKADPTNLGGLKMQSDNVLEISPVTAADSGNHATLQQFGAEFPKLLVSSNKLAIPSATGAVTTYRNGELCPSTSKYPKKAGQVEYAYWSTFTQKTPTITTNPGAIKLAEYMRVTMAFDPKGVVPTPPSTTTVNAMVAYQASSTSTTTTTAATATTTTTTKATTTTTAKG